jgi:hypothetical protein
MNISDLKWMKIDHCSPNNAILSYDIFSYVRLTQNLILVGCFALIFILYAFICVFVVKRRRLKLNRDNYHKEIIMRSKQNTVVSIARSEPASRHESFMIKSNSMNNANKFVAFHRDASQPQELNRLMASDEPAGGTGENNKGSKGSFSLAVPMLLPPPVPTEPPPEDDANDSCSLLPSSNKVITSGNIKIIKGDYEMKTISQQAADSIVQNKNEPIKKLVSSESFPSNSLRHFYAEEGFLLQIEKNSPDMSGKLL